MIYCRGYLARG